MFSDFKNYIIGLLFLVFCFSLYKNISYPLLWNDESESTMMATRVLTYGYPKVNDGKNRIFASDIPNSDIGYNKKLDACTYITWGNYYFATIGVTLAKFANDIYSKTALIRIPYATMGLLGLIIFIIALHPFFLDKNLFKWFVILFLFIELFSISLVLHMRDARSYPLVIFICACFFYVYVRRFFFKKINYYKYALLIFIILTIAFHTNFIAFVILTLVYCAHQFFTMVVEWIKIKKWDDRISTIKLYLKDAIPVIVAGLLAIPFILFFELLKTSQAVSEYHHYSFDIYTGNFKTIFHFFSKLEFLYTVLVIKIILIGIIYFAKKNTVSSKRSFNSQLLPISIFLLFFIVIYILMIARIPYYIFARYIIVLQVAVSLMMMIDLFAIVEYANHFIKKQNTKKILYSLFTVVMLVFCYNSRNKMEYIKGHIYELTHQYKGSLDYIIPFIKDNFKHTDSLTIATNYEEYSYMYYLNSKVIIGYCNNNLEDDVKHIPDIIMYRKTWGTDPKVFNDFMQKTRYQKVAFPVADYPVNNIPELDFAIKHQFKTKFAANENEKAEILVRVN